MAAAERLLTFLRDVRRAYRYRRPYVTLLYRGVYASYAEAAAALPAQTLHGFDHQVVVDFFAGSESRWKYLDYPAAFWLREVFDDTAVDTLVDLGGGWGQTFYAYQHYLRYPQGLCWTVCDLPAFVQQGEKVAQTRGAAGLRFVSDLKQAGPCDVLFTGGALQYMEPELPALLRKLPRLPRHVIAHHVPMYDGERFYTIQRMSHSYVVYKINNRQRFVSAMSAAGYELRDTWSIPRTVDVIFQPARRVTAYSGFYFQLRADAPENARDNARDNARENARENMV